MYCRLCAAHTTSMKGKPGVGGKNPMCPFVLFFLFLCGMCKAEESQDTEKGTLDMTTAVIDPFLCSGVTNTDKCISSSHQNKK